MTRKGIPANTIGKQFSLLIKPASADCNLNCKYCFFYQRPTDPYDFRERHRMSDEVLASMISQYLSFAGKYTSFGWQGGEPLLMGFGFFRRVVEFQQMYGYNGQYVGNNVQTNATLITPDLARLFHDYNFLLGVSLDGPEEYHDLYRRYPSGRGSYRRIMESIQILEEHKVEFNILAVVNDITAKKPDETYSFFLENGFYYLQYIPAVEFDRKTGQLLDFSVNAKDYGDFLCRLFDLWYNNGQPIASIRTFENIAAIYMGVQSEACVYRDECGTYAVVEHSGDVYPCDFFVEKRWWLGNLMETPLKEIVTGPKVQAFNRRKSENHPECQGCKWKFICRCGCQNYWDRSGNDYLCSSYKQFFAHSEGRFKMLAEKLKRQHLGSAPAYAGGQALESPRTWGSEQRGKTGASAPVARNSDMAGQMSPQPQETYEPAVIDESDDIWKSVGRNDPCPCGSGKKYKKCCMLKRRDSLAR